MPRTRKRKTPVSVASKSQLPSPTSDSTRTIIRRFHVLLKQQASLLDETPNETTVRALGRIEDELDRLGGLEAYQRMSAVGQDNERGGGSEKVLIAWLKDLGLSRQDSNVTVRLLEVGALKPDNYHTCSSWLECTSIDLHSRHPLIKEQDFLLLDEGENREKWDTISLSLVLNFVPRPKKRGDMLKLAHSLLKQGGHLFLVLPLPCVLNSRYLDLGRMQSIMEAIGFAKQQERWKKGGKMIYWLFQKTTRPTTFNKELHKRVVLRQGSRNNFSIVL